MLTFRSVIGGTFTLSSYHIVKSVNFPQCDTLGFTRLMYVQFTYTVQYTNAMKHKQRQLLYLNYLFICSEDIPRDVRFAFVKCALTPPRLFLNKNLNCYQCCYWFKIQAHTKPLLCTYNLLYICKIFVNVFYPLLMTFMGQRCWLSSFRGLQIKGNVAWDFQTLFICLFINQWPISSSRECPAKTKA